MTVPARSDPMVGVALEGWYAWMTLSGKSLR